MILGPCYMLWLYKRVWFSEIINSDIKEAKDIKNFEFLGFFIMASLVVILGLMPDLAIKYFTNTSAEIAKVFVNK